MKPAPAGLALLLLVACGKSPNQSPAANSETGATPPTETTDQRGAWFQDATLSSGVRFVHEMGATPERHLPETMGGGGVLFDAENDGDWDLYLVQSGSMPIDLANSREAEPPNQLFANAGDGTFTDVTASSGDAAHPGYGQGCACGDIDGDGFEDLYVTNFGADVLLLNSGQLHFADVTSSAGLSDARWTAGAVFFDADADGDLDLFVTAYVAIDPQDPVYCGRREDGMRAYCSPDEYGGLHDRLWINDGAGAFVDGSANAGLTDTAGKGLGVLAADFNGDRRLDLYVANDSVENRLWAQEEPGRFTDATLMSGTGVNSNGMSEAGMGLAAGDVDGDGDLDLFVTNLDEESNTLYRNDGEWFTDVTSRAGLDAPSRPWVGFGAAIEDFDLDGDLDIAVANGHIIHNIARYHEERSWAQPMSLYENDGTGRFATAVEKLGPLAEQSFIGRALLPGDLDGDGDTDLVLVQCGSSTRILRNETPLEQPSLRVRGIPTGGTLQTTRGPSWLSSAGPSYYGRGAPEIVLGSELNEPLRDWLQQNQFALHPPASPSRRWTATRLPTDR